MSHRHNVYCKENYQITDRQNVLHNTHTFNKSNSIFQTNTQNNLNSSAPLYSWYLQGLPVFHAKQFFYYVYTVQPFEESCLITDYCIQLMSKHVDKYTKYSWNRLWRHERDLIFCIVTNRYCSNRVVQCYGHQWFLIGTTEYLTL